MQNKTLIIAEAGVNHNGKFLLAKKLIDIAKKSGADIIKFQTFKPEKLVTKKAKKAKYQEKNYSNESQYKMLKKLELSFNDFKKLKSYAEKKKIEFMSTAFEIDSLKFLKKLKVKRYKIPSGEITNYPFLKFVGSLNKKIILSTGMSTLKDINLALKVITKSGTKLKNITVLHCNTAYPTPFKDVNLNAMSVIRKKIGVDVGYSDHTLGIEVPLAAVSLGAKIIEKHFTISRKLPGPDHHASLEPKELKKMILSIRKIEKSLGKYLKVVTSSEKINKKAIRKSIIAFKDIYKGDIFSKNNLVMKRPGDGISPMMINKLLGKKSKRKYKTDQKISNLEIKRNV
jgi:N,N'-diacetyllegionaminate synthase